MRIPDYGGNCITQLPAFFQHTLLHNRPNPLSEEVAKKLRLDDVNNVVFFLVDGFGARQWTKYRAGMPALQRFEKQGAYNELDTVFPSSTPVALNTLHTNGLAPMQHGLIDWWLYIEELDKIIATLPFAAMGNAEMDSLLKLGADPSILVRDKTTYEALEAEGIHTRTFMMKAYMDSVYTNAAYKGSEIVPFEDMQGLFDTLQHALQHSADKPSYNFVYWSAIDVAGHTVGPHENEYVQAVDDYFTALEAFFVKAKNWQDTVFVISADHGQVRVHPEHTIYLDKIDGLADLFKISPKGKPILPWGGAREVFLSIKEGEVKHALQLLERAIGEQVELRETSELLQAGVFGKAANPHPHLASRIGDIVLLPKDNRTVWYHHPDGDPFSLQGHHGGLSDSELKVPFGVFRPARQS